MTTHDVIDNRHERLVDNILKILPAATRARFAVGYFFLSGLEALGASLDEIGELRLLIGNTSNRETIEHLSAAYKRLELVSQRVDEIRLARAADQRSRAGDTAADLRDTVGVMDQTDEGEALVHSLIRMIEDGRLKVRVYTKGRLHAKAYIFDWTHPTPGDRGLAIVGSSNLTLSGVQDNTELNVIVHDNASPMHPEEGNHAKLTQWFEELWSESLDFDQHLMAELRQSWAGRLATPYDVYMKTLYTLVRDRLEERDPAVMLGEDEITRALADFQRVAVRQAIRIIQEYDGCFVADVVGLGKSFIGAAIVKHFERAERKRALIICPKSLEEMWTTYNEIYQLNAQVLPMSMLQEGERGADLLADVRYRDRDLVLVDESHNFRHSDTQRYRALQSFIAADPERKVCLLTATPRNSRAWDVYNQIRLFHREEVTSLPITPPNLRDYFKAIDDAESNNSGEACIAPASLAPTPAPARLQTVLQPLLIRRTRRHVLRWYGYAEDSGRPLSGLSDAEAGTYLDGASGKRAYIQVAGRRQFFPRRELETLRYSIEETYSGLYEMLLGYLGKPGEAHGAWVAANPSPPVGELTYARYGLYHYVWPAKRQQQPYVDLQRAGRNLRGLIRTMLFKRFESSVEAFRKTLERMIRTQTTFLQSLNEGFVPAGEKAERLLGQSDTLDEDDLLDALEKASGQYRIEDLDVERLGRHIDADVRLLRDMLALVTPITPERDDKLKALRRQLSERPVAGNKCLIFTQYADTAAYLYRNLNPGNRRDDVEVIFGNDKSKARVVGRFAPRANPQFQFRAGESEIRILVATDVLAEGLNLQDCDIVINYDLHWNPVRLIQRFGRIDRIGSEHSVIWAFNFLPETGIEKNLHLTEVLKNRIREIHDTIGEDAAILDRTERLNPDAMYAIYEGQGGRITELEDDETGAEYVDLNEAEETLRRLRQDDPEEFKRITELRDGIRGGKFGATKGRVVFCQAGRFQQLSLLDEHGEVISRDTGAVLALMRATPDTTGIASLPRDHNDIVMREKRRFTEETNQRRAQQEYKPSETAGQRYVLNEIKTLYGNTEDEEMRARLQILERAFRLTPTTAIRQELNRLRRDKTQGAPLVDELIAIYQQHRLQDRLDQGQPAAERAQVPRVVCSLALV